MGFKFLKREFSYMRHDNIVLHQYKAIFFPIPKVACTSLKKICSDLLEIQPPNPKEPLAFIHKRTYPYVKKQKISKNYKDYFRFCFIRNPWDRLLSCYKNKIHPDKNYNDPWFRNGVSLAFSKYGDRFKGGMSFDDFVESVNLIPDKASDNHFRSQHCFVTDKKGNQLVNFIGRFEKFDHDFDYVRRKISLPLIELPHLMKGDHKDYRFYYTAHTQKKVGERYAKDIELFGYDF